MWIVIKQLCTGMEISWVGCIQRLQRIQRLYCSEACCSQFRNQALKVLEGPKADGKQCLTVQTELHMAE